MRIRKTVDTVLLMTGLLFVDTDCGYAAEALLKKKIGSFKEESPVFPFVHTSYYADEMGEAIKRKYIIFDREASPAELAQIKHTTNAIETRLAKDGRRTVNIDPGYIHLAKVVLASAKDFSHRIYIGKGIFAEVTLLFVNKSFQTLPWTYPDYSQTETIDFFNTVRNRWYDSKRPKKRQ
jgi:hypothetical protein